MIDLENREIPVEGLAFEGEIADDIFQLAAEDRAAPIGPVRYKARAYEIDGDLVVQGDFHAEFELDCARCLGRFIFAVDLLGHNLTENLENTTQADLTEALREDILLALPVHPHCDEGKSPQNCPAEGKFDQSAGTEEPGGEEDDEKPNPWAELDKIAGLDQKSPDQS